QDISEEDAKAEGLYTAPADFNPALRLWSHTLPGNVEPRCRNKTVRPARWESYKGCFANLWEKVNGPESWDKNPWVWALTFKVHDQNVDDVLRAREAA